MKIVFYNPSRIVGGAEHLFFRLVRFYQAAGIDCAVIDYHDGAFVKLGGEPHALIGINSVLEKIDICCDFFVLPPNFSYEALYYCRLDKCVRLIFWSIHPLNCRPVFPISAYKRLSEGSLLRRLIDACLLRAQIQYARSLFAIASECGALLFMDGENYRAAKDFIGVPLNENYLPIPYFKYSEVMARTPIKKSGNNYFWVGRLVDFKIGALNRLILDLDDWAADNHCTVNLHIVGDGDREGSLAVPRNITIKKYGYVEGERLHKLLVSQADAVFAMGTSVLEAAALGVPAIITMPTFHEIGNERSYMPIFETKGYDLGSFSLDVNGYLNWRELVGREDVFSAEGAERCKFYVQGNHDISEVANKLLEFSRKSSLDAGRVSSKYSRRFPFRAIYSFHRRR